MKPYCFWTVAVLMGLVTLAVPAAAQQGHAVLYNPSVEEQMSVLEGRERDCRSAHNVLVNRLRQRLSWAFWRIQYCEAHAGDALGSLLLSYQNEQQEGGLLEETVITTAFVRDVRIWETALSIVSNPASPMVARRQALRVVYHQLWPGMPTVYAQLYGSQGPQTPLRFLHRDVPTGTALPADAAERTAQALQIVESRGDLDSETVYAIQYVHGLAVWETRCPNDRYAGQCAASTRFAHE
jgi:hypothetical protein